MRKRLTPETRREQIIKAALCLAERTHFYYIKMIDVARKAKCSEALVRHYLGTVEVMRLHVLNEAIKRDRSAVVRQGQQWDLITPRGRLRKAYRDAL
jgi:AcrR family transcriptional regulator